MKGSIVISGMGLYTPPVTDLSELTRFSTDHHRLINNHEYNGLGIKNATVSIFDKTCTESFGKHGWVNNASIFALRATAAAIKNSGINLAEYDMSRISIVLGSYNSGTDSYAKMFNKVLNNEQDTVSYSELMSSMLSHCGNAIAARYNIQGKKIVVSSACSSSLTAVGIATDLLHSDKADVVICGGSDCVDLPVVAGFNSLSALNEGRCAPFSKPAGINLGEGAGILILTKNKDNFHNKWLITGYGASSDAYHETSPEPNGVGAIQAIDAALSAAGLSRNDVDLISAHATGTGANDIPESKAYEKLFGLDVPVSVMKPFYGHTLGASGIVELISVLSLLDVGITPENNNLRELREGCSPINLNYRDYPSDKVRTVLASSFGFGGSNSAVIVTKRTNEREPKYTKSAIPIVKASANDGVAKTVIDTQKGVIKDECKIHLQNKRFKRDSPEIKYCIESVGDVMNGFEQVLQSNARAGVITGNSQRPQRCLENFLTSIYEGDPRYASARHFPGHIVSATCGQVSIAHKIIGHSTVLCSPTAAFEYTVDLLRNDTQDFMIACSSDDVTTVQEEFIHQFLASSDYAMAKGSAALLLSSREQLSKCDYAPAAWVRSMLHSSYNGLVLRNDEKFHRLLDRLILESCEEACISFTEIEHCLVSNALVDNSIVDGVKHLLTQYHPHLVVESKNDKRLSSDFMTHIVDATEMISTGIKSNVLVISIDLSSNVGACIISSQDSPMR
ncbi:beta-ketoacyl-[acyl-carrier-protein] synthase family protein [Serratia proteamaculans]|uniref:beta-ketoacyl-[acyl-carrier-protein] synthase family protein n=1 Tax=Serratia proteamaculans TaxID=28151 RepID=UPI00217BE336|nr:beta-ketoacyl-[acyl-carrier-protein] synthase family protein [Serratia proteamaculans]CAI1825967.1 3-oxoacyl-[acyl-carrier-protein] synthase 2 [Serratia proteamaculans]CAI2409692.1 3-oxoacyl-[acyl-carrier-protein] synthase 2 [Serratia proteamaculans]